MKNKTLIIIYALVFLLLFVFTIYKFQENLIEQRIHNAKVYLEITKEMNQIPLREVIDKDYDKVRRKRERINFRRIEKITFNNDEVKVFEQPIRCKVLDLGLAIDNENEVTFYPYSSIRSIHFEKD